MLVLFQYLIRTPVPQRGDGHADDNARPRQVRVHRVSEYMEGIFSRDTTGGVRHTDGGDGISVSFHQSIPSSNLGKALKMEETTVSDKLEHDANMRGVSRLTEAH